MKKINYVIVLILILSSNLITAQKVAVDTQKSSIEWTGKKIGGQHVGKIQLKSGEFELKGKKIISGNFVVDMTTIINSDLKDESYNTKLVSHLKSDDFFGVEKYPLATFSVTKVSKLSNEKIIVTGNLTIKATTESISFPILNKGKEYTAKIDIDRSKFDVRYGSNSFFDNLGNKAIDNIFTLDIKLVTD